MGAIDTRQLFDLLNLYFPPEWLKAALVLSIISTWVLVALFAYLNQYTQRRYFSLWTTAWLFYALWLTASINLLDSPESKLGMMLTQACIGICALFLFCGNVSILRHSVDQRYMMGGVTIVLLWAYIGIYQLDNRFWLQLPMFVLLGASSLFTAHLFLLRRRQRRYIGASILAVGFGLWSLYLVGYPFLYARIEFVPSAFLLSAVLQMIIAFGMIVLVLEEVRYESRTVRARLRQDVRRTRVLEKEVVATEDKYRNLFNNASEAMFIVDVHTFAILETNEAASNLIGLSMDALTKKSFLDVCPSLQPHSNSLRGDVPKFRELLESAEKWNVPRVDGLGTTVEARAMPVQYSGRAAMQISLRDLSERAKLEQKLRQAEKLSALGQLISGVAHELNNPLAIIMGRAQLIMSRETLDPKVKSDISLMSHESERASRIVQRLLAFARPQPPEKKYIQLNHVITQVADLLKVDINKSRIRLELELDPGLPHTMADAHQLEQVLMNLTQNAKHAISDIQDGRQGVVRIRTETRTNSIRISVTDNGPGIPPQHLGKIFDPFFTTKPMGVGTGLGLSICYSILAEHGGNLFVQSEVGRGASFIMELPIVAEPAPSAAVAPTPKQSTPEMSSAPATRPEPVPAPAIASVPVPAPSVPSAPKGNGPSHPIKPTPPGVRAKKPRILLVDDEPAISGVLSELLSASDYEVDTAMNGSEALKLIGNRPPDLIISDLKMPVMDGREFYKNLQQRFPPLAKRIIFLTGDTVSGDTREFLDGLSTPWLSKPFNICEVEDTVRSSLASTAV